LHLGQLPTTTSRISQRSRKPLALFAALILSSGTFVLLSGEAWAQQQPTAPHQQRQLLQLPEMTQLVVSTEGKSGVEEYPAAARDKGVAELVDQVGTVEGPMATATSLPTKPSPNQVGPASEPTPKLDSVKTPGASLPEEPKKPKVEKPVAIKAGDALPEGSNPRVLVRPGPEPERDSLDLSPPTPDSVLAPASKPSSDTASEQVAPEQSDPLPALTRGESPAAARGVSPTAGVQQEDYYRSSGATPLPEGNTPAEEDSAVVAPVGPGTTTSTSSTGVPAWAVEHGGEGLSRATSTFETVVKATGSAVGSAMGATLNATTSATAQVLQSLANGSGPGSSSGETQTSPMQEDATQTPSQTPAPPLLPPIGDGLLFSSAGTGQAGSGSGYVMLLLGVLASGLALLMWRDGHLFLASWEIPKPTCALLSPLERPG
jgi:hypothetical protein